MQARAFWIYYLSEQRGRSSPPSIEHIPIEYFRLGLQKTSRRIVWLILFLAKLSCESTRLIRKLFLVQRIKIKCRLSGTQAQAKLMSVNWEIIYKKFVVSYISWRAKNGGKSVNDKSFASRRNEWEIMLQFQCSFASSNEGRLKFSVEKRKSLVRSQCRREKLNWRILSSARPANEAMRNVQQIVVCSLLVFARAALVMFKA